MIVFAFSIGVAVDHVLVVVGAFIVAIADIAVVTDFYVAVSFLLVLLKVRNNLIVVSEKMSLVNGC